jgi:hypothetical protein
MKMKHYKHTVETMIKRSDPYILHQIQRAHHILISALVNLKSTNTENLNNSSSVNNLILILEDVMAAIQQAREHIVVTDSIVATDNSTAVVTKSPEVIEDTPSSNVSMSPSASQQQQQQQQQQQLNLSHATTMMLYGNTANPEIIPVQQSFYPVLPRDVVIQFRICEDAKLQITLFHISFMNANTASNRGDLQHPNKPWFLTSKTGEVALVTEEYSTTCVLSYVSEALNIMASSFKQCVRLRDKLTIHRSYCSAL